MSSQIPFRLLNQSFFNLLGFLIALTISLWIANLDLKPKYLSLNVQGDAEQEQTLKLYFMKHGESAPFISQVNATEPKKPKTYYFNIPKHFSPDNILIDLGTVPSTWTIHSLGVYAHFFAFDIIAYEWPLSEVAQVTSGSRQIKTHLQNDNSLAVSTLKEPGHIYFPLDYTKLKSTPELLFLKACAIASILGIFLLLFSRYFWQLFTTRKIDAKEHELTYRKIWQYNKLWMVLGSLLLVIILIVLRYSNIETPSLFIEDTMEFSDAMTQGVNLFAPETYKYYRGYTVLLSELLAYIANIFPLDWQPLLYLSFGMFFMCIAVTAMAYSGLFSSKLILLIAPLALCLGCFTDPAMYLTLTGTLFSSTALLMALAVRPAPMTNIMLLAYLILVAVLAFSGPYSTQLLPFAFGLLLFNSSDKKSLILITIIFLAIAYTLSSSSGMMQLSNILDSSTRVAFFNALVRHIFLLEIFPKADYKIGLVIIAVVVGMIVTFRQDRIYVKHSLIFLAVSVVSIGTYFISFKYGQYGGAIIHSHTVISQFCWMIFILLSVDKLLFLFKNTTTKGFISLFFLMLLCTVLIKKDGMSPYQIRFRVDKDLSSFISAVKQARTVDLQENEFIQLWHINNYHSIISIKVGSSDIDAVSVEESHLPSNVRPHFIPVNFDRKRNTMLRFNSKKNAVYYSDGTTKKLSYPTK